MDNNFLKFLESLEDIELVNSSEEEKKEIVALANNKLPKLFWDFYSNKMPAEDVEFEDFVFYGLERMIEENTDYVPGCIVLPYGLFTFASTLDGDAICFDLNQENFPVYQCSHSLIDEDEISYYTDKMHELETNYDNILKVSPRLANSFDEFVEQLQNEEMETFSVSEIINNL